MPRSFIIVVEAVGYYVELLGILCIFKGCVLPSVVHFA